jgi:P-type Ca2+ transporter type 2C
MSENPFPFSGLSDSEVDTSRKNFGINQVEDNSHPIIDALLDVVKEPMFILLMVCAAIYFILGEQTEAWFMTGAILLVSGISFFQESRSRKATDALRQYTRRSTDVIRNNQVCKVPTEEIVIGDYVVVSEGHLVPADGRIIQMNDLSVMESILTGESFPVSKSMDDPSNQQLFQGTIILSGQAVMIVNAISKNTVLGKIAVSVDQMKKEKTALQLQIDRFVFRMAVVGGFFFLLIWGYHFYLYGDIWASLLQGLTIAMSVLPEEIPVAFSTFMALGAWRLLKSGIIVKKTQVVESLGAANVICVDKTGTITQNSMTLKFGWVIDTNEIIDLEKPVYDLSVRQLIETAMWASEPVPFDPMERSIHQLYSKISEEDKRPEYYLHHEYPLGGTPPAMTHVFKKIKGDKMIIACKGAPEFFTRDANLSSNQKVSVAERLKSLTEDGYRVLGVGYIDKIPGELPDAPEKFSFNFAGLIAFYDPPKENIREVIQTLERAGIQLKIVTGDIPETAVAIAQQAGMSHTDKLIHADEFRKMNAAEMTIAANENFIFTRMYPDLKLKLIRVLKESGNTVGMTGDGVNDGPALKAADIGIAMGKRGTEIARDAASIILTDDDFGKMTVAVEMGRKIYINLKKAIRYIISIHIPIILTVAIPLFLGWEYLTLFTPVHIIFFELIMGPTCSIVYENEPIEKNIMQKPPRFITSDFLNTNELMISVLQGLMITAGVLIMYRLAIFNGSGEDEVRTMLFLTLITSNILLTLVNRSFYYSVFDVLKYKNPLLPIIILITILLTAAIIFIPSVAAFFKLCPITAEQAGICFFISFISVFWFEIYKYYKRIHSGFEKENIHAAA